MCLIVITTFLVIDLIMYNFYTHTRDGKTMETAVQPTQTRLFIYCLVFPLFCPSPIFLLASKKNIILPAHAMRTYGSGILPARYLLYGSGLLTPHPGLFSPEEELYLNSIR